MPQTARHHVVLNNGDPARIAVLVAKPLENPLRGMPLLPRPALIRRQDTVDDPGERVELRTRGRSAPPIPGRHRKRQHLGYWPRVNAKLPRRFPSAQTLDLYRVTNPTIKLNHLHPPPSAITPKGYLLPEFYSGATGPPGRFNEGFLLRRLQFCPAGRALRRTGCVVRLGDAAIQHDELDGAPDAQRAVVLCPVRARGHRRTHPRQDRRLKEKGHVDGRQCPTRL